MFQRQVWIGVASKFRTTLLCCVLMSYATEVACRRCRNNIGRRWRREGQSMCFFSLVLGMELDARAGARLEHRLVG